MIRNQSHRGRPPVYTGRLAKNIVRLIKTCGGLKDAREYIASTGVQKGAAGRRTKMNISLPTLSKLAKQGKIKLRRGRRPATVAA